MYRDGVLKMDTVQFFKRMYTLHLQGQRRCSEQAAERPGSKKAVCVVLAVYCEYASVTTSGTPKNGRKTVRERPICNHLLAECRILKEQIVYGESSS